MFLSHPGSAWCRRPSGVKGAIHNTYNEHQSAHCCNRICGGPSADTRGSMQGMTRTVGILQHCSVVSHGLSWRATQCSSLGPIGEGQDATMRFRGGRESLTWVSRYAGATLVVTCRSVHVPLIKRLGLRRVRLTLTGEVESAIDSGAYG